MLCVPVLPVMNLPVFGHPSVTAALSLKANFWLTPVAAANPPTNFKLSPMVANYHWQTSSFHPWRQNDHWQTHGLCLWWPQAHQRTCFLHPGSHKNSSDIESPTRPPKTLGYWPQQQRAWVSLFKYISKPCCFFWVLTTSFALISTGSTLITLMI